MTDKRDTEEMEVLAAEQALRLTGGSGGDGDTRAGAARWRGRLAPLFDEVAEVQPPSSLWGRIDQAISPSSDNVVLLRRVARWRSAAAAMTAIAASLAMVLLFQPRPTPSITPQPPATPMVAMLGDSGKATKVMASWDPAGRQLVLAVAGDMPADPAHAHELWVIPSDGKPRSLGTMPAGKRMHMRLVDALATLLQQGATIAISVEPRGGSPTGQPTGPVVASGSLDKA